MAAVGHRTGATAKSLGKSSSAAYELHLALIGDFDRPVDLTRALASAGMSLQDALTLVDDLSAHREAATVLFLKDASGLAEEIKALGLECSLTALP